MFRRRGPSKWDAIAQAPLVIGSKPEFHFRLGPLQLDQVLVSDDPILVEHTGLWGDQPLYKVSVSFLTVGPIEDLDNMLTGCNESGEDE